MEEFSEMNEKWRDWDKANNWMSVNYLITGSVRCPLYDEKACKDDPVKKCGTHEERIR